MINWDKILSDYSLDDIFNLIERNKPRKNNRLFNEWQEIYEDILHELYSEEEHFNDCTNLINRAIEFLKKQKELNIKGMVIPIEER